MDNEFKRLETGEVVSLNYQQIARLLSLQSNGFSDLQIKTEQLEEVITRKLNVTDSQGRTLFNQGVSCEVMKFGSKRWQKGRLRVNLTLEFCPNEPPPQEKLSSTEPESVLDDLRQIIQ
jgi:hypothetical protein